MKADRYAVLVDTKVVSTRNKWIVQVVRSEDAGSGFEMDVLQFVRTDGASPRPRNRNT